MESDTLMVMDFWHEHCLLCLRFNPVFDEIADEYAGRVKFVTLNILEKPENREIPSDTASWGPPPSSSSARADP